MSKHKISAPFFVINPKSFLYGEALDDLAAHADDLAKNVPIDILFTAPTTELASIAQRFPNLIVTAQHADDILPGDSMGKTMLASLEYIGVKAVVLNHADHPLALSVLKKTIDEAKKCGIQTIVCADSVAEAQAVALLNPTIVLAEPTEIIGQAQISSYDYVTSTIEAIKKVNSRVLVEQGAGIRSADDVMTLLNRGADGVGVTSGIVKAENPKKAMQKMIKAVVTFKKERE